MATIAEFGSAKRRAAKAPISAHPAFPAIVALWFAALLGLGSLVLPVALLEKLVTVTHIAALIPSAEPPLGFTARAGIAIGASITGAIVGLMLARQVARSEAPEPRTRSFAVETERPCRPISARDELGEEGLDSPAAPPAPLTQKRRSLAMAENNSKSQYLLSVPLPGQSTDDPVGLSAMVGTSDEAEATFEDEPPTEADHEPLELAAFAGTEDPTDEEEPAIEVGQGLETLRHRIHTPQTFASQDAPMTDSQDFRHSADFGEDDAEPQEFQPSARSAVPQAFASEPEPDDPLPFAAPSQRRIAPAAFDEEEESDFIQGPDAEFAEERQAFSCEPTLQLTVVETAGEPAVDDRPLEELGLVQLAARLGASIEKRRQRLAGRQATALAPLPSMARFGEADFEAAEAEDAARAIADFFGPARTPETQFEAADEVTAPEPETELAESAPAFVPASMRSVPLDQIDDDDESAFDDSLSLPLAHKVAVAVEPAPDVEAEDEDYLDEDGDEGDYSSLLAMKNPFARQQEFVRVDEPEDEIGAIEPAVTFPSPPPAAPVQAAAQQDDDLASRPFDPPKKASETAPRPVSPAAPRDPGDAERSLRDALATLQRMSGAA